MKTHTEFNVIGLKNALKLKSELNAAGKTPEEITAALTEGLKLEGEKLALLLTAVETVEKKMNDLKRVVVFIPGEGEKAPSGAVQKGDHWLLAEYYVSLNAPEKSRGGRDGGRDRGDRKGGRGDKGRGGGGRDKGREGSGGALRGERAPRAAVPAPVFNPNAGKIIINPPKPKEPGSPEAAAAGAGGEGAPQKRRRPRRRKPRGPRPEGVAASADGTPGTPAVEQTPAPPPKPDPNGFKIKPVNAAPATPAPAAETPSAPSDAQT
jgi:hypothetical protein